MFINCNFIWSFVVIHFHYRKYISLSLFEESTKGSFAENPPVKRGRGRPPKLKAVLTSPSQNNNLIKEEAMSTPLSYKIESPYELDKEDNLSSGEEVLTEETNSEINWQPPQARSFDVNEENQQFEDHYEEDFDGDDAHSTPVIRDFSQNNVALNLSWSLMNQLRNMSKMEGISVEDLLVELVAEATARRVFEDQTRPAPSHLMTRTGYIHSDITQTAPQPHLSHHMVNNNTRQQQNNLQNRNRFSFQQKNPQQQNNNKNYQQNNNNLRQPNNNQNNFRHTYNNNSNGNINNNTQQQRFNPRPNYQKSYDDQPANSQSIGNQYRPQRDTNKRP